MSCDINVFYCGFIGQISNEYQFENKDEDAGKYSEQNLRKSQSILKPVPIEAMKDFKQSDRIVCLTNQCIAIRHHDLTIWKFKPRCSSILSVTLGPDCEPTSIYAEPSTDRLLILTNNKKSNLQEIKAFHELTGTKSILTLQEGTNIEHFSCGDSLAVMVTEKEDIFKITKCKSSDWVLHCQPATLTVIDQVSCGNEHVLALSRDKRIFTLGNSSRGQLGLGSTRSRDTFTLVDSLEPLRFLMVVAGGWHCLALSENGDLYSWGWNESGQVGVICILCDEQDEQENLKQQEEESLKDSVPKLVFFPTLVDTSLDLSFCKIHAGSRHSTAVSSDGDLYTWGWNGYGQLCHGDQHDRVKPCIVGCFKENELKVTDVYCGPWSTVVVTQVLK